MADLGAAGVAVGAARRADVATRASGVPPAQAATKAQTSPAAGQRMHTLPGHRPAHSTYPAGRAGNRPAGYPTRAPPALASNQATKRARPTSIGVSGA